MAADALIQGNPEIEGRAYFITNGEGANFFHFYEWIVEEAGYKIWPENLWLPRKLAYAMGSISEDLAFLMRPIKRYQPKFIRFAFTYTCNDFIFSADKDRQDFGFEPKYSAEEALQRTIEYYKK